MRVFAYVIILAVVIAAAACAADATKFSVDLKDVTVKQVIDEISTKSGAAIVLDPKATGSLTAHWENLELSQALDVVTKSKNLSWKKLQFAKRDDSSVTLDQLKSAVLTLATVPLVGLAIDDPSTKTGAMFAKNLPTAPDMTTVALPEGYSWTTVYVVLAPEAPAAASAANADKVKAISNAATQNLKDMAGLTPEERQRVYASEMVAQMSMTPEARQALLRDRMEAMRNMDSQYRDVMRQDMRAIWGDRGGQGGPRGNRDNTGGGTGN